MICFAPLNRGRGRKKEREREAEIFLLLVYSPKAHNNWGWARQKPEARNFPLWVADIKVIGHYLILFRVY